ncbi:hypothetical protein AGMMS50256_27210 [Betaproteobacteria bacterium]|nr:hypothetical protein AGMMS50256_27210 [Betaproteobacteria bacterium]
MAITDSFKKDISAGNITGLRSKMKNSLLSDLTFSEFNDMNNAAKNVQGLYDVHDNRELNPDKSAWNGDYENKLMVQVVGNFSHERVEHIKEVVRYLRPVSAHLQPTSSPPTNGKNSAHLETLKTQYQRQKREDELNNRIVKFAVGAAAGAAVGGVIAGFVSKSLAVGVVATIGTAVIFGGVAAVAITTIREQ